MEDRGFYRDDARDSFLGSLLTTSKMTCQGAAKVYGHLVCAMEALCSESYGSVTADPTCCSS